MTEAIERSEGLKQREWTTIALARLPAGWVNTSAGSPVADEAPAPTDFDPLTSPWLGDFGVVIP